MELVLLVVTMVTMSILVPTLLVTRENALDVEIILEKLKR
jgi:hypothetical protein